jgi:hypothetical protein
MPLYGHFVKRAQQNSLVGLSLSDLNPGCELANRWPLPYNQNFADCAGERHFRAVRVCVSLP